jgi:hypothetical protein
VRRHGLDGKLDDNRYADRMILVRKHFAVDPTGRKDLSGISRPPQLPHGSITIERWLRRVQGNRPRRQFACSLSTGEVAQIAHGSQAPIIPDC